MEFRFLNRQYSDDEKFSRIFFYSVVFHYLVFFLLFGNPFLILGEGGGKGRGKGDGGENIDVQLLSSSQIGPVPSLAPSGADPIPSGAEGNGVFDPKNFPAFRPEEGSDDGVEEAPAPPESPPPSEAGISMAGDAVPPPKPSARRMPKSMTAPEDCLLKVVGMVCPSGDAECLADYVAFCRTLR